jgi:uncharacterized membrane protein YGL010W
MRAGAFHQLGTLNTSTRACAYWKPHGDKLVDDSPSFTALVPPLRSNKWNQLIHIVFVPMIVWSAMVFLIELTPGEGHAFVTLTEKDAWTAVLPLNGVNLSLPVLIAYAAYYMALDFWPGVRQTTRSHVHATSA